MTPPLARRLSVAASLAASGAAILAATPSGAAAQRGSSIHGTVTSGDHVPIMGARVSLVSPERVIITNDAGTYILRDVPAGKYTVYASAIGKKPDSSTVTVTAGNSATLDFSLKEGSLLLSSIIVSATRTSVDASKVASTVNVLTPEQVRQNPAREAQDMPTTSSTRRFPVGLALSVRKHPSQSRRGNGGKSAGLNIIVIGGTEYGRSPRQPG